MQNATTAEVASRPDQDVASELDRHWSVVAACAVCLMLSVGTLLLYSFSVFVRPLATEFHWSRTEVSGALTIGRFVVAVSCPFWGLMIDRFGPRRVILPSIVLMSLFYTSLSLLTPPLWHLYVLFALFTLFGGAAAPVGYAAVLVRSFDRHLGLALMGIGFGASLLPKAATFLITTSHWRHAYAAIGLATLVLTLPAAFYATRFARLPVAAVTHTRVAIGPMLRTRAFLLMCGIFILLGASSGGTLAHIVSLLMDRGITQSEAATIASVAGIAVICGRAGIGWLLDRFNAGRLLACVALVILAALVVLLRAHSIGSGYVASLLVGSVLGRR